MDFVAIDFETANRNWNSACEIGLVIVEGGRVVDTYRRLIRPSPLRFDAGNIRIHKIRPEHVVHEPTFGDLYDELLPYLADKHLVAHNASFDMGVLLASARLYGMPTPSLTYSCTVQLARRVWPEAPRYGLGILSSFLGIALDHHQALSDANACAHIMLQAQRIFESEDVEQLLGDVGMKVKSIFEYGKSGKKNWHRPIKARLAPQHPKPRTQVHNWPSHPRIKDITFDAADAHPGHPCYGKRFVFTGELSCMSREEAMRQVLNNGGKCTGSVTGATDYLVKGVPTYRKVTGKQKKAEEMAAAGKPIEVIDEARFFDLIGRTVEA